MILKFIQKNLLILIILVIGAGLFNVKFFGGYKFTPLICLWAALIMIYPSLVPLSFDKLKEVKKYWRILLLSVVLNFILIPITAYLVGQLFLPNQPVLQLGLILLSLLPGGGMVTTWALKSKADMLTTIGVVLLNLLLAIVIVPFGLSYAMNQLPVNGTNNSHQLAFNELGNINSTIGKSNADLMTLNNAEPAESCIIEKATKGIASCNLGGQKITPIKIAIPIVFIILVPIILTIITQQILFRNKKKAEIKDLKNKFGAFSNLGLLIVLFMLMSLEDNIVIFDSTVLIWDIFVALLFFYGTIFSFAWFSYKKLYFNSQGKALLWGSYLRYITLALGFAISLVYQDKSLEPIILIIVLSYLIQIPSSYLIANLLRKH